MLWPHSRFHNGRSVEPFNLGSGGRRRGERGEDGEDAGREEERIGREEGMGREEGGKREKKERRKNNKQE